MTDLTLFDLPPAEPTVAAPAPPPPRQRAKNTGPALAMGWPCPTCGHERPSDLDPCEPCTAAANLAADAERERLLAAEDVAWRVETTFRLEVGEDAWYAACDESGMLAGLHTVDPEDTVAVIAHRCEVAASATLAPLHRATGPEAWGRRERMYATAWSYAPSTVEVLPEVWGYPPDTIAPVRVDTRPTWTGLPPDLPVTRWVEAIEFDWDTDDPEAFLDSRDNRPLGLWWPYPARRIEPVDVGAHL